MKDLVARLNKNRFRYAITGATAASYYGLPRTTTDVDFIIQVFPRDVNRFVKTLQDMGLVVDKSRIVKQLDAGCNVVTLQDRLSPYRADFIIQSRGKMERLKGRLLGISVFYQSPESLILAKLRMIKATRPRERSMKDRDDIKQIMKNTRVDKPSVERRAGQQQTLKIFRQLLKQ